MTQSNQTLETTAIEPENNADDSPSATNDRNSMEEYYQLIETLLITTFAVTAIIVVCVWIFYSLNTALNYLLGSCVGVVYLRMLGKDVERLGKSSNGLGSRRFALFAALIIVASQWQQLHIVPVFLGFLTYKVAIIVYTLQTSAMPAKK